MAVPSVKRITSKGGDAIRALRRTPAWVLVVVCALAIALTWFGWKLLGASEQDSLTIEVAAKEFPAVSLGYSSAPFGLDVKEHPIPPEVVIPPKVESRAATVTVTPVGEASIRSRGNEIWLVEVVSEYARVDGAAWGKMALPQPWTASGVSALNATGAPVPLHVGLAAGSYVDAKFVSHPWSGRVRIDAGGRSDEIDLYAHDPGYRTVRLMLPVSSKARWSVVRKIPRAAGDLTLGFSGGTGTVRLTGVQRRGVAVRSWRPEATDDTVFGPGVKVLARDSEGVLIGIPDGGGWVRLSNTATPYWTPRLKDLAVVLGMWLAVLGVGLLVTAVTGALAGAVTFFGSLRPSRPSDTPGQGRRQVLIDGILLVAASAWLFVLVCGVFLGAYEVATRTKTAKADWARNQPTVIPSSSNIIDWAPYFPRVWGWWAARPVPRADGGDYLRVLSREPGESIADILGVAIESRQAEGVRFSKVIVPEDLKALHGQDPFYEWQISAGKRFRMKWQVLREVATYFTDVPYIEKDYNPVITEQQLAEIPGAAQSEPTWSALAVGDAPEGASGTWVLYAAPSTPRKYVLVPIEASPIGQRP